MEDGAKTWLDGAETMLRERGIPTVEAALISDEQDMRVALTPQHQSLEHFERLLDLIRPAFVVITRLSMEGFFPTVALIGGVKDVLVTLLTDDDEADEDDERREQGLGERLFGFGRAERSTVDLEIIRNCLELAAHNIVNDPDEGDWEPVSHDETFRRLLVRAKLDSPKNEELLSSVSAIGRYDYRDIVDKASTAKRSQHRAVWRREAEHLAQELLESDASLASANLTILRGAVFDVLKGRDQYCTTKESGEPVVQAIAHLQRSKKPRGPSAAQDGLI